METHHTNEKSERTPGYSFRRMGADRITAQAQEDLEKREVHGDGERGIPVRTATPEDAERAGRRKPSPLE
ncbi:hypothetical protein JI721_01775 [Alicyclobacillus cycloheptanicus]|uniref:Uncharacterized protein n=1 Tax=Alicyclobacillus cycloheptanicus TaxID=1457 RepID=A0ABT9XH10_9BACL|nr:hypothetical protein [Alicyclobacillus cycloheptanicus]MDQ0189568.1 hypothetical protein [Alicyclobacillus cycloheptanicus]WDM01621.1 hypothetical protein JI721_01775 [Alicyclobacillus cycloheptanicus]